MYVGTYMLSQTNPHWWEEQATMKTFWKRGVGPCQTQIWHHSWHPSLERIMDEASHIFRYANSIRPLRVVLEHWSPMITCNRWKHFLMAFRWEHILKSAWRGLVITIIVPTSNKWLRSKMPPLTWFEYNLIDQSCDYPWGGKLLITTPRSQMTLKLSLTLNV